MAEFRDISIRHKLTPVIVLDEHGANL